MELKTYPYNKSVTVFKIITVSIVFLLFLIKLLNSTNTIWVILISSFYLLCIYGYYLDFSVEIQVDDKTIRLKHKKLCRDILWSDIAMVMDDSFFPWIRFLHWYHIVPKGNFLEKNKRIIINSGYENYVDLLREVVFHLPPDARKIVSFLPNLLI